MHKNGIKNFIYSFMLSLFAVILVNKAIFRAPEKNTTQTSATNITKQNISLFSTPSDVAKIMQTDLKNTIDISEIDKITTAAAEAASPVTENTPPAVEVAIQDIPQINTDIAAAEEIILEKENIITKSDTQPDYEKSGIVYADISDTIADEKEQSSLEAKVIYFPDDDAASITLAAAQPLVETPKPQPEEDTDTQDIADNEDIPLQENTEVLYAEVNVRQSADNVQIAMLEPNTLVSNIENIEAPEEKTLAEADLKQNEWVQMSDKTQDSPWVVAKGNKFAKNKAIIEQYAETKEAENTMPKEASLQPETVSDNAQETKVAYQMIQNLLIPIPDDIMNDSNLTPQLSVTPKEKPEADKESKKAETQAQKKTEQTLNDKDKQSGLFKSIASWFSDDKKTDNEQTKSKSTGKPASSGKKSFDFFGLNLNEDNTDSSKILPAELRLSFQPNRAEISGQTLRWIHAFADNVRDNDNLYIEIRIDGTSSFALQKKRLNLLSTILANRGVDFRKINIVFTSREPNSFIIRNIRFNNEEERAENKNNANSYYRPW